MRISPIVAGIAILIILGVAYFLATGDTAPTGKPGAMNSPMTLTSPAFGAGAPIPPQYTCDGDSVSPPLVISGVPEGAGSLVLIMDDPDVPKALKPDGVFDHWILYGIPPETKEIPEGALAGAAGLNGAGEPKYAGPCPPPQYEPREHRYFFRLYALKGVLNFVKAPTKSEVLAAI
ncbi:MAG: YbhB/YbcL family Raf kinase inhibitor-like protein, partial [Patescibacteria group bacterium]